MSASEERPGSKANRSAAVRRLHIALARRARIVALLCALPLAAPWLSAAMAGQGDPVAWIVDLVAHWQWLYTGGLVAATLVAATLRPRWLIGLVLVPLPWLSASSRLPLHAGAEPELVVASANVHVSSRSSEALREWIASANADFVVLVEVSAPYAEALRALPGYPYRHVVASDDPFGIAVLSRHPMQGTTVRDSDGIARIEAQIEVGPACIDLFAIHPMPPIAPRFHAARNDLLLDLATRAREGRPVLVVGDLNATPWSNAFTGLAERGLLRATGLRATWPGAGHGWFGIPIDHVLASRHWQARGSVHGPDLGSDHLPLLTRLALVHGKSSARACDHSRPNAHALPLPVG